MKKSLSYAEENQDEARAVVATYTEIDPTVQEAMVLPKWTPEPDRAALETLGGFMVTDGLLTSPPDLAKLLD